jgi:hypothetical protein
VRPEALRVLDVDRGFLYPGVAGEVATNEVAVGGPGVIAVGGAVGTTEAFALAEKIEEVGFLLVGEGQFAAGEEVDGVVVAEVSGGEARDVRFGRFQRRQTAAPVSGIERWKRL